MLSTEFGSLLWILTLSVTVFITVDTNFKRVYSAMYCSYRGYHLKEEMQSKWMS